MFRSRVFAAVLASVLVCGAAKAAVLYRFELMGPGDPTVTGVFEYTSADFITSFLQVPASDLDSCTAPPGETCGPMRFYPDVSPILQSGQDLYDAIGFGSFQGAISFTSFHYFANGALGQYGAYTEASSTGDNSRLTVSEAVVTPVPEPDAWALLIGGFAAMGAMLRGRRARVLAG